ncbi:MAG: metallophosphoesterase family protein [Candidatus Bathyarchaeia archaeon]
MYSAIGRLAEVRPENVKRVIVVGDLHGDSKSFRRIEGLFGGEDLLIFLGDYGDRGPDSLGVIEGVQSLMQEHNERVIALKGNHEDYSDEGEPRFYPCTLIEEVDNWRSFFQLFKGNFLNRLYLAATIPDLVLFVHGGISTNIGGMEDLISPSRGVEDDVLWSDPCEGGEHRNPRGAGVLYGPEVSKEVMSRLGVKYLVRSHEPLKAVSGPSVEHEGRVVTISSTRVYGGRPFVLILPMDKIPKSGVGIEKYAAYL